MNWQPRKSPFIHDRTEHCIQEPGHLQKCGLDGGLFTFGLSLRRGTCASALTAPSLVRSEDLGPLRSFCVWDRPWG